jgi:hypothetical protein
MSEIMVNEMSQLPNNIAVNKPVPGELNVYNCILLKNANTNHSHSYSNVPPYNGIKNIRKERYLI